MKQILTVNPLTRISGFMQIQVEVENHRVVDAKSSGLLFRGFELMLKGREPLDAVYFTERICGICSAAHSIASTAALEDAMGIQADVQGMLVKNFIHCCEFLQNHLRHFYQYVMPDFVKVPGLCPADQEHYDYRLPKQLNKKLADDYVFSIQYSREAHKLLSMLGGKAPHNHGILPGGTASGFSISTIAKAKAILNSIRQFVINNTIEDVYIISEYYGEYFSNGAGHKNIMTYGAFEIPEAGISYVNPLVRLTDKTYAFDSREISENIYSSWYEASRLEQKPTDPVTQDAPEKTDAYSWVKAPRYHGEAVEVGPLARMILSGSYRSRISTMDRYIARILEIKKIIEIADAILDAVDTTYKYGVELQFPDKSVGKGLIDTTRGSLGHWLSIEGERISNYQIITPSAWNLSSMDSKGVRGVVEQALIGTEIEKLEQPIEIGRIVRSFDPCVSCATHVVAQGRQVIEMRII